MEMLTTLFSSYKLYIYGFIAILLLSVFSYIMYLRYDNVKLASANIQLEQTVSLQTKTIETLKTSINDIQIIQNNISKTLQQNFISQQKLEEKLDKLSNVSIKKPELVTNIINKASKERNRCFELATGASIEKNEKNSVCPNLVVKK